MEGIPATRHKLPFSCLHIQVSMTDFQTVVSVTTTLIGKSIAFVVYSTVAVCVMIPARLEPKQVITSSKNNVRIPLYAAFRQLLV